MDKAKVIKDWILETIKNTPDSVRVEINGLSLWRNEQKINGITFMYHFQYIGILHANDRALPDTFQYRGPGTRELSRDPSALPFHADDKLTQISKSILEAIKNEGKFELLESGQIKPLD